MLRDRQTAAIRDAAARLLDAVDALLQAARRAEAARDELRRVSRRRARKHNKGAKHDLDQDADEPVG